MAFGSPPKKVVTSALWLAAVVGLGGTVAACGSSRPAPLTIGALYPLNGPMSPLAREEYQGVLVARDIVNQDGGIDGRPVQIVTRDVENAGQMAAAAQWMHEQGVQVVLGTYSSDLSIPASAAVAQQGMVYWESGAVADQLTGRGLPLVFRVGADGSRLGENSAVFTAQDIAPLLHTTPQAARTFMVVVDDAYGLSVAGGVQRGAATTGLDVVGSALYDGHHPDWSNVLAQVQAAHPDVLVLVSHLADGVAFRRAMVAANVHVDALIGSTMAQCVPDFGAQLGADAVGVFASDRPTYGFNPAVLDAPARAVYDRLAAAWHRSMGSDLDEESIAGFSAAWALFHQVLPHASALTAQGIAAAARHTVLPQGSLPDGAGLRFSTSPDRLGQNELAAAVIWQWQAVRKSVVIWPPQFAWGAIDPALVPLPR